MSHGEGYFISVKRFDLPGYRFKSADDALCLKELSWRISPHTTNYHVFSMQSATHLYCWTKKINIEHFASQSLLPFTFLIYTLSLSQQDVSFKSIKSLAGCVRDDTAGVTLQLLQSETSSRFIPSGDKLGEMSFQDNSLNTHWINLLLIG